MQAKSILSCAKAVASRQTNTVLISALVLGVLALGLRLMGPESDLLGPRAQDVLQAVSLLLVALVISGKYSWNRQSTRKEAAKDRQLQAMLSMFMVVKHELHNDMQVVMGNAELASMMLESGGGAARKPVENINEAAALAIDRIQQLSVFSASMQTTPGAVDINALLRETTARLASELPAIVMLRLELEPIPSRVVVDRNLLGLSLSYLIRLAVKTLAHGGEIVIKTGRAHAQLDKHLIIATMDIYIVRGLSRTEANTETVEAGDRQQAKFERVLNEARNTTQALVERSGAHVLVRPFDSGNESLIKIGFVAANATSNLKESVVIDEF